MFAAPSLTYMMICRLRNGVIAPATSTPCPFLVFGPGASRRWTGIGAGEQTPRVEEAGMR